MGKEQNGGKLFKGGTLVIYLYLFINLTENLATYNSKGQTSEKSYLSFSCRKDSLKITGMVKWRHLKCLNLHLISM